MDIDPGSVLTNRGLNGYGYGFGAAGHGNFAGDGSAVKEGIRGNRDIQLLDSVNANATQNFLSSQVRQHNDSIQHDISVGNNFLTDRINAQGIDFKFASLTAEHASLERQMIAASASVERLAFSNQAALISQLHAMDLKQTECCCELKAGQAAIAAKLDADRAAATERENDNLRLQIQIINQGRGSQSGGGES